MHSPWVDCFGRRDDGSAGWRFAITQPMSSAHHHTPTDE